jgi:hypothetical protein
MVKLHHGMGFGRFVFMCVIVWPCVYAPGRSSGWFGQRDCIFTRRYMTRRVLKYALSGPSYDDDNGLSFGFGLIFEGTKKGKRWTLVSS